MKRRLLVGLAKRGNTIGILLALAMFSVVIALSVLSTLSAERGVAWVDHTRIVIESLDALAMGVSEATSARRAFSLTGESEELARYAKAKRALTDAEARVRTLTADNASQQRRLDALEPLLAGHMGRLDMAVESRRTRGLEPEREANAIREASAGYAEVREVIAALVAEERRLLLERERRAAESIVRIKLLEAAGAGLSLMLITAVVVRLRREIRRGEESARIIRDSEEAIAQLNQDLERRVEARTAELKMANRELESFSYSVVHDLRAPLRGMGGFAEVLLDECGDTLSADAQDSLREIKQSAQHMARLIDALVSMSRVTRSEMSRRSVDLTSLARNVASFLAAVQPLPVVALVVQENLTADLDPSLARTLVEILLENSWKFSTHSVAPRVDVGATETDGERIFFVRDTGAGFDMAYADKLFSPFGRLHTVGEFPGMGIGLATAQRIVQRHGGRIWGDGRVGQGASFYFTLRDAPGEATT